MYEQVFRDQSTGTLATTNWSLAISADGTNDLSAANWATAFSVLRYLKFAFSPGVPLGAVITSVTLNFYYHSNTAGDTACWTARPTTDWRSSPPTAARRRRSRASRATRPIRPTP